MARKKNGKPAAGAKPAGMRSSAAQQRARGFASPALSHAASDTGFTMRDEARNTAQSTWSLDKLREKPVTFVSAGLIEPSKWAESDEDAENVEDAPGSPRSEKPSEDAAAASATAEPSADEPSASAPVQDEPSVSAPVQRPDDDASETVPLGERVTGDTINQPTFFFDLSRDTSLANPSLAPAIIPNIASSAEESDSSEEVILFKGRSNMSRNKTAKQPEVTHDQINLEITTVETSISLEPETNNPLIMSKAEEDDAIVADYIANMTEDSDRDQPYDLLLNSRDLGGDSHVLDGQYGLDQTMAEAESDGSDDDPDDNGSGEEMAIDDETLARLLSRQEELGMGGDELLLTDKGVTAGSSRQAGKSSKLPKNTRDRIPSASAVADAFDDLDLMDWNRPSLQNFGKGRRGKPIFGVVDPDMESAMQAAWENDREKKKQRRSERENLRAQGLLGKNANPDDLRIKYRTGMTLEDIKVELRTFLISSDQTLQLPPMDKSARKILHEFASKLNIKSNSVGSGDQRRPVLARTKRTLAYVEEHFEMATSRVSRKYFPRMDMKGKAPQKAGGRNGHSAVTYREGEVVGASAPELGEGNKGRAMLEKMGWSTGMGLGSMDNMGILQPVAHVVKRTKAGLGQG